MFEPGFECHDERFALVLARVAWFANLAHV
jgi:hypothetical protein